MPKQEYGYITQEEQRVGTDTAAVVLRESALAMIGRGGMATKRYTLHRPGDIADLESNTLDHQAVLTSKLMTMTAKELVDKSVGPVCDIISAADEARAKAICFEPIRWLAASGEGLKAPKKMPEKPEEYTRGFPITWQDPFSITVTGKPKENTYLALAYFDYAQARPQNMVRIIDDMALELISRYSRHSGSAKGSASSIEELAQLAINKVRGLLAGKDMKTRLAAPETQWIFAFERVRLYTTLVSGAPANINDYRRKELFYWTLDSIAQLEPLVFAPKVYGEGELSNIRVLEIARSYFDAIKRIRDLYIAGEPVPYGQSVTARGVSNRLVLTWEPLYWRIKYIYSQANKKGDVNALPIDMSGKTADIMYPVEIDETLNDPGWWKTLQDNMHIANSYDQSVYYSQPSGGSGKKLLTLNGVGTGQKDFDDHYNQTAEWIRTKTLDTSFNIPGVMKRFELSDGTKLNALPLTASMLRRGGLMEVDDLYHGIALKLLPGRPVTESNAFFPANFFPELFFASQPTDRPLASPHVLGD